MKQLPPPKKMAQILQRVVAADPSLEPAARLLLYQRDDLFRLEVLASILNDVPVDSPRRQLADLIERLVTIPTTKQQWVKQGDLTSVIGPTLYTPAPGSPLYGLNKFLETNPCILRIEGQERASGNIEICPTHIPIPVFAGLDREADRVLWLLWEVFYHHIDLGRLKKCPICSKCFVDHSKNKSKARCSAPCTWQRWSWEARKKTVGTRKAKGGRHAKAKKA